MNLKLEDKIAVITGSTVGIGFAIALGLAREGARVILNGRTQARVDAALARIRRELPQARTEGVALDLGTAAGCEALVRRIPSVDVLVNNLGIFEPKAFEQIPDADWQRLFEVNVMSGVRLSRAYLPRHETAQLGSNHVHLQRECGANPRRNGALWRDQDGPGRGRPGDCRDLRGHRRHGQQHSGRTDRLRRGGYLRSCAGERAGDTPQEFEKQFFRDVRPSSLLKRFIEPEEVAALVVFVCSPEASAINGTALRADGGVVEAAP